MSKIAAPQLDKIMKQTAAFNTEYSEACTKSGAIFMKGMEDIMEAMMSLAQSSAEKQAALVKEIMSVKNANDFTEIQNRLTKSGFDELVSSATNISKLSKKVLTDSAEPVNAQITKAVQKASKSMAA